MKSLIKDAMYSATKLLLAFCFAISSIAVTGQDEVVPPKTVEELLELVAKGQVEYNRDSERREQEFRSNLNRRQQMLNELKRELQREKDLSVVLAKQSEDINVEIENLRARKEELQGSLQEVFGNLQGISSETAQAFSKSIISGQLGTERIKFLDTLSSSLENEDSLPNVGQFERLWLELLKELYEQGRIVNYDAPYTAEDGETRTCTVVRIGSFNVICDGKYIVLSEYNPAQYSQLSRQPGEGVGFGGKYLGAASRVSANINTEVGPNIDLVPLPVGMDPTGPTGSSLLRSIVDIPSLTDRIDQGGPVGYSIIVLGIFGVLLAIFKMIALAIVEAKVKSQTKRAEAKANNPLGRVLMVYNSEKSADLETLETKLAEAIVKERPSIEKFIGALKIIAAVAPLMGLLGTVTGMIVTFQQITLFGTGDPKTMAGGISQALVTTVLGLCVAIPTLLLHSIVHSRARVILHIIEERSIGLIARKAQEENESKDKQAPAESKDSGSVDFSFDS